MDRDTGAEFDDTASVPEGALPHPGGDEAAAMAGGVMTARALMVEQGRHRFYSLALPSDLLAQCCMVEPRNENPIDGFQRLLDERRARSIARYIDSGFGTVPGAIVLSAQTRAHLRYDRETATMHKTRNRRQDAH